MMEDYIPEMFNLDEINGVLAAQRDPSKKEIGDRVNIIDFSSCTYINGEELDTEADEFMQLNNKIHFIVIETQVKTIYDAIYKQYLQDLVLYYGANNTKFRINSGHVKIK